MKNSRIDVRPVSTHVGAETHGVDLSQPLDDQTCGEIRAALNERGVIFFRDQDITPEHQLAFSHRMGESYIDPAGGLGRLAGYPEIGEVRKEPEETRNIGG